MHRSYSCVSSYTRSTDWIPSLTTAASRLFAACGFCFFFFGGTKRCQVCSVEAAFYMIGGMSDVKEKAAKLAAVAAGK